MKKHRALMSYIPMMLVLCAFFIPHISHATVVASQQNTSSEFDYVISSGTGLLTSEYFIIATGTPIASLQVILGPKGTATSTIVLLNCGPFRGSTTWQAEWDIDLTGIPVGFTQILSKDAPDIQTSSVTTAGTCSMLFQMTPADTANNVHAVGLIIPNTTVSGSHLSPYFIVTGTSTITGTDINLPLYLPSAASTTIEQNCLHASSTGILDGLAKSFAYGMCLTGAYLFIPNTQVVNQFNNLQTNAATKFPFSWFYSVQGLWASAQATSSSFYTLSLPLHDLTASSTNQNLPRILPNITLFSQNTITYYLSTSTRDTMKNLIRTVLWGGVATDVYFTIMTLL